MQQRHKLFLSPGSLRFTSINLIIITKFLNFFFPHQKRGCQFYFLMKKTIITIAALKGMQWQVESQT